ncbi:uncharacterized protein LACBIDRAFT_322463 [Laccaria bicolor S238N-H82]|uniref:Predicted protein n=1 Tax=Laccaria bicolor (strain S238N-H82 / ATCC MYA-4686) TaxID=486041 RepID=B0CWD4_LACBS|nr:uncharacterized protein LACBIDRAFT_322463 [Laccaria bicolor S238N-H82]EDR13048.1 predicted protein [Laccaria bicolor S238N-H82]|eukprot:XP_001875546.1 predicted protein [Laccaria bicolor S238N-H82]
MPQLLAAMVMRVLKVSKFVPSNFSVSKKIDGLAVDDIFVGPPVDVWNWGKQVDLTSESDTRCTGTVARPNSDDVLVTLKASQVEVTEKMEKYISLYLEQTFNKQQSAQGSGLMFMQFLNDFLLHFDISDYSLHPSDQVMANSSHSGVANLLPWENGVPPEVFSSALYLTLKTTSNIIPNMHVSEMHAGP